MVLVVRTDIGMTKGKAAAQCAHAAIACYESLQKTNPALLKKWRRAGQPKITVQAKSQDELLTLQGIAMSLGVTAKSIMDAGRTQLDPGTMTVLGVGPAPRSVVDKITGHLKLY
jgi:PTH2 family peptidyl-tRNA hydrolase